MLTWLSVVFTVVFVPVFVCFYNWGSKSRFGSIVARQLLPRNFVVSVLLTLSLTLDDQFKSVFIGVYTVVLWVIWIAFRLQRRDQGPVLLKLGFDRSIVLLIFVGLFGIVSIVSGANSSPPKAAYYISMGVFATSFWIMVVTQSAQQLTANGVQTGYGYFKWEHVQAYQWATKANTTNGLFFKLSNHMPLMDVCILNIPAAERPQVDAIMMRHVRNSALLPQPIIGLE